MPKGFLVGLPSPPPPRRGMPVMDMPEREVRGYVSGDLEGGEHPQRSSEYRHDPQAFPDWNEDDRWMQPPVVTPVRNKHHTRGIDFEHYERHAKRGRIVNYPDD